MSRKHATIAGGEQPGLRPGARGMAGVTRWTAFGGLRSADGARGAGSVGAARGPRGPAGPAGAGIGSRAAARSTRKVVALGNLQVPDSLAGRLFLLSCDPQRQRLVGRAKVGKVLRAAVLVDLQLAGNLVDDGGRARVTTVPAPTDPVLAGVLEEVRAAGPRRWRHWIERRPGATVRRVRDELDRARLIKVEPHRILGIIPADRITVRHPLMRRQLLQAAHDTLRASRLVSRVDLRDASIVVLASTADLRTIVTKEQRIRHKDRLAQLAVRVGPVVPALKKAIQQAQSSAGG
ncbi:Golgi phosphoprotein 3 GPP34 [Kribbella rubisoli]|uniref:Golgi phosphoprotein 3 GPP34 n=1 Tax=Kribbella rubisoli TaxID=3075929 RepID=A0A4Q7X853_9ACTN|nr:GPP34 family phosphoprotein [Kribbella rubisoli]RZU19234.1 Golgi phosphoprotein 3 GPP34 [Kribbella rubisoli]